MWCPRGSQRKVLQDVRSRAGYSTPRRPGCRREATATPGPPPIEAVPDATTAASHPPRTVLPAATERHRQNTAIWAAVALAVAGGVAASVVILSNHHSHAAPAAGYRPPSSAAAHPPASATPTRVTLSLKPSAPVYVCLLGDGGRTLIPGVALQRGQSTPTYRASRFELTLGNNSVTTFIDGKAKTVTPSSQAIGYSITAAGPQPLPAGKLPTCAESDAPAASTTGNVPPAAALNLAASASGRLSYDTNHLSARAGVVTIAFTNHSPLEHNVTVAQGNTVLGSTLTFTGGSRTMTLSLKPGTYAFYCSVPGHRQAGMEGTLTVR